MANNIPSDIKRQLKERAAGQCEICGKRGYLEDHHIVKRRNGIHRIETIIRVCGPSTFKDRCHYKLEKEHIWGRLYKLDLQRYYFEKVKKQLEEDYRSRGLEVPYYAIEDIVRDLMGGRLYSETDDIKTPRSLLRLKYE